VKFADTGLIPELLAAVAQAGYETPTPIQQQAIPPALAGKDVLGCAQTGTGKTAAFSLPVLQRIDSVASGQPVLRALVLTPTRELAAQIAESFATYGAGLDLEHAVIFGGVSEKPQMKELAQGVDILVATPGRLLDLMDRRIVRLDRLEIFVLDEADRMLDMGFIHDVKRVIAALPPKRQTLLFSATMPQEIRTLAARLMKDPVYVSVTPVSSTAEKIQQSVYFTDKAQKRRLLLHILSKPEVKRTLVFSRTKHGANRVVQYLDAGGIACAAIHGNKSQGARTRALEGFRSGELPVLVATDIAARGIDVDGVTHVVNFDLPNVPETYVHRIGRTARAGAEGIAVSFCDHEERPYLADIERLIKVRIERMDGPELPPEPARPAARQHESQGANDRRPSTPRGGSERRDGGGQRPFQARSASGGRSGDARSGGSPARAQNGRGGAQAHGRSPSRQASSRRGPAPSRAR
jgi:ATP-dependent RNA helicase RhlE